MPVLLAEELAEDECPPVRVKILSERLLAFRDSNGKYGLIDEFCAHRGVSLWFGRNEEHGLRCPYHGWKYDVNGQCMEVPSEPAESGFCKKVKLTSYPCVEMGDVIWSTWDRRRKSRRCRISNGQRCRPDHASSASAPRNATGCRRSKAASIRCTCRFCIATISA